jgi:hypothetical protein
MPVTMKAPLCHQVGEPQRLVAGAPSTHSLAQNTATFALQNRGVAIDAPLRPKARGFRKETRHFLLTDSLRAA